jgi:ribonuclease HI
MESQLDAENIEKILEAAQQIERMAKSRPDQAKQMLEQAHHLIELAEQIKRDWLNRFATLPPGAVADALARAAAKTRAAAGETTERTEEALQTAY